MTISHWLGIAFKYSRETRIIWKTAEYREHLSDTDLIIFELELIFGDQGWLCSADVYWASKLNEDRNESRMLVGGSLWKISRESRCNC